MKNFSLKRELIFWIILLVPVVYALAVWSLLPEQVAIHFGLDGQANGWGGKAALLFLPAINLFVYLLLLGIPYYDPKKMSGEFFQGNFYNIRLLVVAFTSALAFLLVRNALTGNGNMGQWISGGVFLFVALLGNFMINVKPNWFIGIRTPWTMSSDLVWKKTHQAGGRLFFYGGLLCFVISFFIKPEYITALLLVFMLGTVLFSVGYSFWLFKQQEKNTVQ